MKGFLSGYRWYLPLLFLLVGCGVVPPSVHQESLMMRLEEETAATEPDITIDHLLSDIDTVVVADANAETFYTTRRTHHITQYPCSNCHTPAGVATPTPSPNNIPAHWQISLVHADSNVMNCATCHQSEEMNTLHTLTGQPISFDASYQLCAQCHSTQYADWLGGAHGKRLEGWAPPRVVQSCVTCHNPHQPAWDVRWPAVINEDAQK